MDEHRSDRRRIARLVVLAVAGLAVAGTSAATPPPAPAQPIRITGTARLTAEQPVLLQPLDVVVGSGQLTKLDLTPSLDGVPDAGTVIASIESADPSSRPDNAPATGLASWPPTTTWRFACSGQPCATRYVLLLTWFGAPPGGVADVSWAVDGTASFAGSIPAGATPGTLTVTAPADAPTIRTAFRVSSTTSGEPVELTETDRFASWKVTLKAQDPAARLHGWPAVGRARLSLQATQTAGAAFDIGGDGLSVDWRLRNRADPPVQIRLGGSIGELRAWASGRQLEFDPFVDCDPDQPCQRTFTVDVAWADARPESVFDAGWTLDVVTADASGHVSPVDVAIETVEPMTVASATASGSFEQPGPFSQPQVTVDVVAPALAGAGGPAREVPSRGLVTVTATSVGPTPLPADAVITVSADALGGGLPTAMIVPLGKPSSFAFEPGGQCGTGAAQTCGVRVRLGAAITKPNRNQGPTDGMVVRIDWTIDAGVGTVEGGTAVANVVPQPTQRP
jgi:hypothetical protein